MTYSTANTDAVFWILLVLAIAAAATAFRFRKAAAGCARHVWELEQQLRARDAAGRDLVRWLSASKDAPWESRLTQVLGGPYAPVLSGTEFAQLLETLIGLYREVAGRTEERAEGAARAAVRALTPSMTAQTNDIQGAIAAMQMKHTDPSVLADSMKIDHKASQMQRRVVGINVLLGNWPGRQRGNSSLLDVMRGAASRISAYERVQADAPDSLMLVTSRVVEPVVLACAELLDNATKHSSPDTKVHVWLQVVRRGANIVIDDSGVGFKPEDHGLATRWLDNHEPVRLTELQNPPKLGLQIVGALAHRYGFKASAGQPSPSGGTRAMIHLPQKLLTAEPAPTAVAPQTGPANHPVQLRQEPADAEPWPMRGDGLPQRRRRLPQTQEAAAQPSMQAPTDGGHAVGAFIRGRRRAAGKLTNPDERNA